MLPLAGQDSSTCKLDCRDFSLQLNGTRWHFALDSSTATKIHFILGLCSETMTWLFRINFIKRSSGGNVGICNLRGAAFLKTFITCRKEKSKNSVFQQVFVLQKLHSEWTKQGPITTELQGQFWHHYWSTQSPSKPFVFWCCGHDHLFAPEVPESCHVECHVREDHQVLE